MVFLLLAGPHTSPDLNPIENDWTELESISISFIQTLKFFDSTRKVFERVVL